MKISSQFLFVFKTWNLTVNTNDNITTSAWNRHKTISPHKNAALLRNGWEHFNIKTFANRQKTAYRRVGWRRLDFML